MEKNSNNIFFQLVIEQHVLGCLFLGSLLTVLGSPGSFGMGIASFMT
jgi:hypothetical protein